MVTYRVLSLDGGGYRGLLTALLLERLDLAVPGFLAEFDLFAGTSTGSLLALGLAAGHAPGELVALYLDHGEEIFAPDLAGWVATAGFSRGPRYSRAPLARELERFFGDLTLGDLGSRRVLVSSFDLDDSATGSWKAKFFHNFPGADSDAGERAVDVALRSCAAPTYFPDYQGYVDGGVVANNPSVCAVAQALRWGRQPLERIALLSLGTGRHRRAVRGSADWGWGQWALRLRPLASPAYELPIVNLMLEGGVGLAHYQCSQLLGERYHRLDPDLPRVVEIDAVARRGDLERTAQECDLEPTADWLRRQVTTAEAA